MAARRWRMSVCALLLACVAFGGLAAVGVAVAAPEVALSAAASFLTDPALPPFPERATTFSNRPDRQNQYYRLALEHREGAMVSSLDVAVAGDRVIDYTVALPPGPYPDKLLGAEDCRATALQFAQRQLPGLFAEGAEVKCEADPKLAAKAAMVFSLYRLQQGVRVPPRALVGVRVYYGKVVRWKPEPDALAVGLEPKLTLEQAQAQEALRPYLASCGWVPSTLLHRPVPPAGPETARRNVEKTATGSPRICVGKGMRG